MAGPGPHRRRHIERLPALASALAVVLTGAIIVPLYKLGPLSTHMALHIVVMNVLAPLAAIGASHAKPVSQKGGTALWAATVLQLAILWFWHLPAAQHLAATSAGVAAMHVSLFAAAFGFWACLLSLSPDYRWHGVLALLVTGKLACLLAGLLVFSPRAFYKNGHVAQTALLDDQHLAGLLMLVACPLSFVLAGVVLTARILNLSRGNPPRVPAA